MRIRILGLAVAAILALQLAVPAIALFQPRPQRFAWHMYSALPPVPEAWVVRADGTEEAVVLEELFVVPRAEIDYATALRDRLCSVSGVVEIRLAVKPGSHEVVRCS